MLHDLAKTKLFCRATERVYSQMFPGCSLRRKSFSMIITG